MKHKHLLPGGRIKAASLPVGSLQYDPDKQVQEILSGKNLGVNLGYFPRVLKVLAQARDRQPLRPYISTHQGMPGNFFPFLIQDPIIRDTLYQANTSGYEVAIEPRFAHTVSGDMRKRVQDFMNSEDFSSAFEIFQSIPEETRAQSKGRTPFFICRPSTTDALVQVPSTSMPRIDAQVSALLNQIEEIAYQKYSQFNHQDPSPEYIEKLRESLLYFQADVHISRSGDIQIEAIHMPDVGFFLETFSSDGSLAMIKDINRQLRIQVSEKIAQSHKGKKIVFLTGNNVIEGKEDLLEQREMMVLGQDLMNLGNPVEHASVETFDFDQDAIYLLFNFSYMPEVQKKLFSLATRFPDNFSPNPFLQHASKEVTGYSKVLLTAKNSIDRFRGTTFYNEQKGDIESFQKTLREYFILLGIDPEARILQIQNAKEEILYVFTDSVYSLRKIKEFLRDEPTASITVSPYRYGNMRIEKNGSDLLHAYRFMYAHHT